MRQNIILNLLLASIFLLFCNTTCDDDGNSINSIEELVDIKVSNYDYSGTELKAIESRVKKEVYVIGVQCICNSFQINEIDGVIKRELVKENFEARYSYSFANVEEPDIITISDFDEKHKAGSSVKDCFRISNNSNIRPRDKFSFIFAMREFPIKGDHQFKVVYRHKGKEDKSIEAITDQITLY